MTSPNLPPFHVIAAALRTTTERLVGEVVNPQSTAPDWNDFEWAVARAVCAMHGLAWLLANRLEWPGPAAWSSFLGEQRDHSRAHYERAGEILASVDAAARDAGVRCIALKGSALRALAIHQPGERPMGDIDLLVAPGDLAACASMLAKIGYEPALSMRRHEVFAPVEHHEPHAFAEHARNPLKIEVHTRIAECLPATAVDITSGLWPSVVRPGINPYSSRVELLRHILLHTAGNMRAHVLRFIQPYDIAKLGSLLHPEEWRELRDPANSWWIYPPLSLAERCVPGSIPPDVLESFRALCPRRLRAHAQESELYEVSWSNLRIAALPGAEWARTPLELLRFAKSRVLPSRTARQELAQAVAVFPAYSRQRWYGVSHFERILRWIFSRPPRVQTMIAVRAALGQ
jgi:hypothetical protein